MNQIGSETKVTFQDISTKAVFMSDGLIVEEGHPKEFFSHPKEEQTRAFLRRMLKREEA